jgi:hypothetical protein
MNIRMCFPMNIYFKIELEPGTAPVYKRPYPMALNELAEMKTQL